MLRDWSDEWKNARLALELRGDELFQGETLCVVIRATVALDTASVRAAAASHDTAGTPASEAAMPAQEIREAALEQLVTRWRRHCDGAIVDLKVVEPSKGGGGSMDKQQPQHQLPQQPRATLFHQESRLVLLPLRHEDATSSTGDRSSSSALKVALRLCCECTLRVRAEFWQRPLVFIARVTPNASRDDSSIRSDENDVRLGFSSSSSSSTTVAPVTQLLSTEVLNRNVFRLLREQTTEPPNLMRRVELKLRVAKPLVLKMETKPLSGQRVAVLARATNTHESLSVRVLDLQLHVSQFAAGAASGATTQGAVKGGGGEYRVAKTTDDAFPVELQPQEQFNFVFLLELIGGGATTKSAESPGGLLSAHSHQSLLTLSWEAGSNTAAAVVSILQPITEHHTILWSPHAHGPHVRRRTTPTSELLEFLPKPPPLVSQIGDPCKVVRRSVDRSCPLSVSLAPLDCNSTQPHRVGVVETLCVVVANRSLDKTEFDLSLVVPPAAASLAGRPWLTFEASHHLGRLRARMIVRKSVRLVFLRAGRADLNALLLFDHLSRTWFLPPSPSASTAWEVVVYP